MIELDAMALLELPRGCDYWHDERMNLIINSTDSHIHDFDGCMYGLTTLVINVFPSRSRGGSYHGGSSLV